MITRRRRTNSRSDSEDKENQPQGYSPQTTGKNFSNHNSYASTPPLSQSATRDPNMTCRDRTNEFMSAVQSLQSRQFGHNNGVIPGRNGKAAALHQRSEFMVVARKIGQDIANTFTKLEKLTILAKRKSLFDDKPVEINELTYIIKQDIGCLNKQIAQLQELVRAQRSQNGKHKQTHSNSVVVALQSKLATMSNEFKSVLEVRTENLKHQKSRREQFSESPLPSSMPPSAMSGHVGSVLLQDEANSSHGGDFAINMDHIDRDKYQHQMQLIEENDSYIQSRADTMQNIEQTIVELGSIFQQLATMVKEQEEMVTRIDSNVEETTLNIEGAHTEILKYFQSVTSNRWLMIKIFGVLIVFFIIFVVFMA